jgi:hypothetical protein
MKKKTFLILGFLLLTVVIFAQDTINVIHNQGESILDFLKGNWKGLSLLVLLFVSEWMGESESIPEGSIWKKIVNWALMFVRSKKKLKSKKAKYLKVLILGLLISGIGISASAQGIGKFFKPVTAETFVQAKALGSTNDFVFHATVGISATQTYIEDKEIKVEPLVGAGVGISYLHFKDVETVPYNDYGVNALALFNMTDEGKTTISPALTFNYQKIGAGVMYNFADKRVALLTTISLTF